MGLIIGLLILLLLAGVEGDSSWPAGGGFVGFSGSGSCSYSLGGGSFPYGRSSDIARRPDSVPRGVLPSGSIISLRASLLSHNFLSPYYNKTVMHDHHEFDSGNGWSSGNDFRAVALSFGGPGATTRTLTLWSRKRR